MLRWRSHLGAYQYELKSQPLVYHQNLYGLSRRSWLSLGDESVSPGVFVMIEVMHVPSLTALNDVFTMRYRLTKMDKNTHNKLDGVRVCIVDRSA